MDPYNEFFNNPVFPGEAQNITAMNAFNLLYSTGLYGIYAQEAGITLIKKHFTGQPILFIPFDQTFTPSTLSIPASLNYTLTMDSLDVGDLFDQAAWSTQKFILPPSYFNLSLNLYSPTLSNSDRIQLALYLPNNAGSTSETDLVINSSSFSHSHYCNFTVNFTSDQYAPQFYLSVISVTWAGQLQFLSIELKQYS